MNIRVFVAGALALAVLSPAAHALTIDNKDKTAYTLKVTPNGGKEMDVAVKASSNATVDCKMGCTLSLEGKTQAVDGKAAKIAIEGGKFVM
jgi:predicted porin